MGRTNSGIKHQRYKEIQSKTIRTEIRNSTNGVLQTAHPDEQEVLIKATT